LVLLRLGEHEMNVDVAFLDFAAVEEEPCLERLDVEEDVRGLGPPEIRDRLGMSPRDVPGLCRNPCALPLPIVFCRRGNAIPIVPPAYKKPALQLGERGLAFGKAGIAVDGRLKC